MSEVKRTAFSRRRPQKKVMQFLFTLNRVLSQLTTTSENQFDSKANSLAASMSQLERKKTKATSGKSSRT